MSESLDAVLAECDALVNFSSTVDEVARSWVVQDLMMDEMLAQRCCQAGQFTGISSVRLTSEVVFDGQSLSDSRANIVLQYARLFSCCDRYHAVRNNVRNQEDRSWFGHQEESVGRCRRVLGVRW